MKHFQFLSLLSVFSFFYVFSSSTTQPLLDSTHAQEWGLACSQQMDAQQLQITANILYLLYANAVIDSKIQQFFTPISRLTQSVLNNMADHKSSNNDIATLKTLLERLSLVTGTRLIYTEMLNVCLAHYDKNQTDTINRALEDLQLYAQSSLRAWADESNEQTVTHLKNCEKICAEGAQMFHTASGFHKALSEGSLPIKVNEQDISLITIDMLLQGTQMIIKNTDTISNTVNDCADHAMGIICIGTELYKQHYNALYSVIASPSFDKQYSTTLFSMHGLLPAEYKSALPNPNHVFEHMLQTTKLYTQSEFIQ